MEGVYVYEGMEMVRLLRTHLQWEMFLTIFLLLVCGHMCVPQLMCQDQRTALWSWFFSSIGTRVPGVKLGLVCQVALSRAV